MKKLIFLIPLIFNSCNTVKILVLEKLNEKEGCSEIYYDGKKPLIDVEVDHVKTKFVLDTGAGFSALLDSTIIPNFKNKKFGKLGSAKSASRQKIKNRFFSVDLNSNLFTSSNKALTLINIPKSACSKTTKSYFGILGMDVFFNENYAVQLDFMNNKICNISKSQLEQLKSSDQYKLVKSKCKDYQVMVYVAVEGKEHEFKLDTGYNGNLIMPFNNELQFRNPNSMTLEGIYYKTVSGSMTGKEVLYEKMPVLFAGEELTSKMGVSTSIKAQNMGFNFMKGFDWIIDYKSNKVFVKRNANQIESDFARKVAYYALADEKLLIVTKEITQKRYQIGNKIISVNNQKVTPENICAMQDLLNRTEDWSTLQLEVLSNLK